MSHVRAKEVELDAEQQMEEKLRTDIAEKEASNAALSKKLEEVEQLRQEREGVGEEQDRLRRETAMLKAQSVRWAAALNNIFKAMSVDLEQLGVKGGRVTADTDLVRLVGVLEAKAERISSSFQKFLQKGGSVRSLTSSGGSSIASALSATMGASTPVGRGGEAMRQLVSQPAATAEVEAVVVAAAAAATAAANACAVRCARGQEKEDTPSQGLLANTPPPALPGGVSPAALSLPHLPAGYGERHGPHAR